MRTTNPAQPTGGSGQRASVRAADLGPSLAHPQLAAIATGGAPLTRGAKGEPTRQVQSALLTLGHALGKAGADGDFGPATDKAVRAFQQSAKLPATGAVDGATLRALANALKADAAAPAPAPSRGGLENNRFAGSKPLERVLTGHVQLGPGAKGEGMQKVQGALLDMGFYLHGGADGEYGAQTAKAIRNFQVHAASAYPDVKPTGVVDAATLRALDRLAPLRGERGQRGNIPEPRFEGKQVRVIVATDEHRTFLYDEKGKLQDIFPNAVGAQGTETDHGLKFVRTRLDERATRATGEQLWKDGTVFGPRMLDLAWANGKSSGEELHGTNAPARLGEDVSHGCIRHLNDDILKLYDALKVGDRVAVVPSVRATPPRAS